MIVLDKKFLKPSKPSRILALLENLNSDPSLSQAELAQKCALSGAMVNKYLHELRGNKMLSVTPVNGKSYAYNLSDLGEQTRQLYFEEYSTELVQLYSALKKLIRDKIKLLVQQGQTRFVLFGASETCEIALSAIRELDLRVVAIVDNDRNKHGQNFNGHIISPPLILEQLSFDAVIITTFARQKEILDQITPLAQKLHFNIARL